MGKRKKGIKCVATKAQKKAINKICRKDGKYSKACKDAKRKYC